MGRAIVREPSVFLMDEPLSNLDAKLRVQMRAEISRLQRELATTTIYVTHDQVEAMTMGDRVAVMRKGELQQVAPPQELYDRPVNLFVGGFIGSPAMNMLEATVSRRERQRTRSPSAARTSSTLGAEDVAAHPALAGYDGRPVILGIRPESMEEASLAADAPAGSRLEGRVELREALGSELMVHFALPDRRSSPRRRRRRSWPASRASRAGSRPTGALIVGRFGARAQVVEGGRGRGRGRHARRCTSSTPRQDLESTSRRTRKEQQRETWLDDNEPPWWRQSIPLAVLAVSGERLGRDEARTGGIREHHLRRGLDRRRGRERSGP